MRRTFYCIAAILSLAVSQIFGAVKGIAIFCFALGVGELIAAKEHYNQGKKKISLVYGVIGMLACAFAIISLTNII